MTKKLSEAKKRRIKDENIYAYSEHLLNIIWACRDNAIYNNVQWYKKDQYMFLKIWTEFRYGCVLGDGRKWYNRLSKQFESYELEHGKCIDFRVKNTPNNEERSDLYDDHGRNKG